jgi:hypothetical protein
MVSGESALFLRISALIRLVGAVAVLAASVLLPGSELFAQGRGPSAAQLRDQAPEARNTPENRARKHAEIDAWLRRLPGRFRISGVISNNMMGYCAGRMARTCYVPDGPPPIPLNGMMDCVLVGQGPGVNCVINADWKMPDSSKLPIVLETWLSPGVLLFGMEPDASGIRYLQVSDRSVGEEGRGKLTGEVALFTFLGLPFRPDEPGKRVRASRCPTCSRSVKIIAPADSRDWEILLVMNLGEAMVSYELKMQRLIP